MSASSGNFRVSLMSAPADTSQAQRAETKSNAPGRTPPGEVIDLPAESSSPPRPQTDIDQACRDTDRPSRPIAESSGAH